MTRIAILLFLLLVFGYGAYAQLVSPSVEELQPPAEKKKEGKGLEADLEYLKQMMIEYRQNKKEKETEIKEIKKPEDKTTKKSEPETAANVKKDLNEPAGKKKETEPVKKKKAKTEKTGKEAPKDKIKKDKKTAPSKVKSDKEEKAAKETKKIPKDEVIILDKNKDNLPALPAILPKELEPVVEEKHKEEIEPEETKKKSIFKKKKKKIETTDDYPEIEVAPEKMTKDEESEEDIYNQEMETVRKKSPATGGVLQALEGDEETLLEEYKTNPMIFTRARMVISPQIPPNSDEDYVEVSLLVEIERGRNIFPQDITIHEDIKENEGILFIFEKPGIQVISLSSLFTTRDFVFLDEEGKVVEIRRKVRNSDEPIVTLRPVDSVLQLMDGGVKKYGIKIGDKAKIETNVNFFK